MLRRVRPKRPFGGDLPLASDGVPGSRELGAYPLFETLGRLRAPRSSHRCKAPLADLRTPRDAANERPGVCVSRGYRSVDRIEIDPEE
jgi:hypothetical protein